MAEEIEFSSTVNVRILIIPTTTHEMEVLRSATPRIRGIDISIPKSSRFEGSANYAI
jgi:uncharacterized protein YggT (Ycf19 family)